MFSKVNEFIVGLPSFINGLNISVTNPATPAATLVVTSGYCRDSSNSVDMFYNSSVYINGLVNGVNGLDVGTLAASTVYSVYAIACSGNAYAPAMLISLNDSGLTGLPPVLPYGYDVYRHIGYAITDSSTHFLLIYQTGTATSRTYTYDVPPAVLSGGSQAYPTFAAIDLSAYMPAKAMNASFNAYFVPAGAGDVFYINTSGSSSSGQVIIAAPVASKASGCTFPVVTSVISSKPKIDYCVTTGGGLTLHLHSFTHELG